MPIHQSSHINHVEEEGVGDPVEPSEQLAILAVAEGRAPPVFFTRNPKIILQNAAEIQKRFARGRNGLDSKGRLLQAESWKIGANALLKDSKPHGALVGYVVGIWYLRQGSLALPLPLAHTMSAASEKEAEYTTNPLGELARWLPIGDESGEAADVDPALSEGSAASGVEAEATETDAATIDAAALRSALYLNAAAAALKLSVWSVAQAACERVLRSDGSNSKALYRLAKAHEGEGDLSAALSTVVALLKHDSQNRDARKLLDALKQRQAEEKAKFKELFANSGEKGE